MLDARTEDKAEPGYVGAPEPLEQRQPHARRSIVTNQTFLALVGALVLAVLYGRVALLNVTSGVVGGDQDGYDNVWNNWWVKTALIDLHRNPFYNDYIYYPTGVSLRFHTLNPLNGLITMPFNLTLGYIPTLNLLLVFALVATLFCSFLMIKDIVGNPWAAFAGGALFTYANHNVIFFFSLGQTNMITMHWLPLYFFFLMRAVHGKPQWIVGSPSFRQPTTDYHWLLYGGLSVLVLVAMSLTDWQFVVYAVFATLFYFTFLLVTQRTWREKWVIFTRLAAIGVMYVAVVAFPLLIPMFTELAANPWLIVSNQSEWHSMDLLYLIGPGLGNPGYLAIAVAWVGLVAAWKKGGRDRETALFWMLVALFSYLMTLGPKLIVNGQPTNIPMPYAIIQNLPLFNVGRDPGRFNILALLGLSILVAFGLRNIFSWLSIRAKGLRFRNEFTRGRVLATAVTFVFLIVTLSGFMVEIGRASKVDLPDWPDFYTEIAHDKEQYSILELPLYPDEGRGATHYNMYQILHQKPRFAGRWARDHKQDNPNNFVKTASLYRNFWLLDASQERRDLSFPTQDFLVRTDYTTQGVPILNYYNTRYIVLYKEAMEPEDWPLYDALIERVLGSSTEPYRDERLVRVYRVPDAPPPANPLTLDVGNGWYPSAVSEDGRVYRWADNTSKELGTNNVLSPVSELYTMNLRAEPVSATLIFTAYTWQIPRTLKVALNGQELASIELSPEAGDKRVALDLMLPSGNNKIIFSSPEPPQPTGNPEDARLLNFGMYGVELKAK